MRIKKSIETVAPIVLALAISMGAHAQGAGDDATVQNPHTVSTGPSVAYPLSGDSERTSSWGADYMYRLNPKWEIGAQLDINFDKGLKDYQGYTIVPVAAYTVTSRFNVFMGAGFEHDSESSENELALRLGAEYTIFLNEKQNFLLLPGSFVDWVDGESFLTIAIAFGYNF